MNTNEIYGKYGLYLYTIIKYDYF